MKIGIHFSYWAKDWVEDYHRYIDKAADLGFDILEISCSGLFDLYREETAFVRLKEHAQQRNLHLTAGYGPTPFRNLCSEDPAVINRSLSFYKKVLPLLHFLGIHILAGPLYSCGRMDSAQALDKPNIWKRTQDNLWRAAEIAEKNNVVLALEVVNRYEGFLLNTCEEALRFIEEINHPHVQIMLDTFHMNIEETNLCSALRLAGNRLKHLHVSEQNRHVPGQGSLPWKAISNTLRSINYSGALVIESFVQSSGNIGKQARIWQKPHSTPMEAQLDKDAANSLALLRSIFSQTE